MQLCGRLAWSSPDGPVGSQAPTMGSETPAREKIWLAFFIEEFHRTPPRGRIVMQMKVWWKRGKQRERWADGTTLGRSTISPALLHADQTLSPSSFELLSSSANCTASRFQPPAYFGHWHFALKEPRLTLSSLSGIHASYISCQIFLRQFQQWLDQILMQFKRSWAIQQLQQSDALVFPGHQAAPISLFMLCNNLFEQVSVTLAVSAYFAFPLFAPLSPLHLFCPAPYLPSDSWPLLAAAKWWHFTCCCNLFTDCLC